MQRYEFAAFGQRVVLKANSKLEAYAGGNALLDVIRKHQDVPQGAWMETRNTKAKDAIGFYWAEGNFFD